jgi:hypothetical protein
MGSLLQLESEPALEVPWPAGNDSPITDEELTALALAADRDAPLDPDAVPLGVYLSQRPGPLPDWYMPMATTRVRQWRWPVVMMVVSALLLIAASGLCVTYGQIVVA